MVCLGFEPVAAEWKAQTNPKSLLSLYFFVSLLLLLSPSMFMFSLSVPLYLPIYCVFCSGPLSLFVHFPVFYYIMFLSSSLRVLVNFSWASVAQKKKFSSSLAAAFTELLVYNPLLNGERVDLHTCKVNQINSKQMGSCYFSHVPKWIPPYQCDQIG